MTSLVRFSPLVSTGNFQQEVDRMFERFLGRQSEESDGSTAVWSPRVDLSETEDAYLLRLDLPGLSREDVTITYEDGTLKISGERSFEGGEEQTQYHRIERWYGRFFRSFNFGRHIAADRITATFDNGVLSVALPKPEEKKPFRVEIG